MATNRVVIYKVYESKIKAIEDDVFKIGSEKNANQFSL